MKTTINTTYTESLLNTVISSDNIYQRLDAAAILIAMLLSEHNKNKQL